jgi:hypothetical protein
MKTNYIERLLEPELLFGLTVRFFGVFAVLIILMAVLYISGWLFTKYRDKEKETNSGGHSGTPAATEKYPPPPPPAADTALMKTPGSVASGEEATAIALCIRESLEDGSLVVSEPPSEAAVAIALALSDRSGDHIIPLQSYGTPDPLPSGSGRRESPWKLLGRQEAISRNDPWTGRWSAGRVTTNRERKT